MKLDRPTRACTLLLAVCFSGSSHSAYGQTIDQAIWAAFEVSPSIDRSESERLAAREGVVQARAAYLPEVSLDASISTSQRDARLRGSSDFSETSEPSSATIRLEQSLYTNGLRPIAQRRAAVGARARTFELAATQNAVALQTVEAMVRLHQARAMLESEFRLKELIVTQLVAEQERFRLETGTVTDVTQAEARLAAAEASIARAEAELLQAERLVELLTGLTPSVSLPPLVTPETPASLDEALFYAREYAPELALARSAFDVSRLAVASASRQYGPQVGLSVEASTSRRPSPAIEQDDDVRATITLSVPLFNGGRDSSERRQAFAQRNASEADMRQAEQDLELKITASWLSYISAEQQIRALEVRLSAAGQALEGVRQGRSAGLWTVSDILDAMEHQIAAEQDLTEARSAQIVSAYELSIACALYELPF